MRSLRFALLVPVLVVASCGPSTPAPTLDAEALRDPEQCARCHPTQYAEWSGSMHAYAAEDPVFRAMNARGQRETNGALGSLCIGCHAPVAVRDGLTTDGLNIDQLPKSRRGVTCFFCHSVDEVTADHNNPLHLAGDGVLRGGIVDPVATPAHRSAYSPLHDRQRRSSATLCGPCHDIVTPANVFLERTYHEWQSAVYSTDTRTTLLTCGKCHMAGSTGLAAQAEGAVPRTIHSHAFPGVDVALTDFPHADLQRKLVTDELSTSLAARLCVMPDSGNTAIAVTLDNVGVGHMWPSGAAQDRRAWAEVVGFTQDQVTWSSGKVADGDEPGKSPDKDLWLLRDELFDGPDGTGKSVHMFWEAKSLTSELLPPSVTNDPRDPRYFHAVTRTYKAPGLPDRVTLRVRIRPFGLDVIDDLVASGDLDAAIRGKVPTFDLGSTVLEWTKARGYGCVP